MNAVISNPLSLTVAVLLIAAIAASCKSKTVSGVKVVGGTADSSSHPAAIGLFMLPHARPVETWGVCTGSIISDRLVLTAAHCIHDGVGTPHETHFPVATFFKSTADFDVEKAVFSSATVLFPGYQPDLVQMGNDHTDVAMAIFPAGTFPTGSGDAIGTLATSSVAAGQKVSLVGYGLTSRVDMKSNKTRERFVGSNTVAKVDAKRAGLISLIDTQIDSEHAHVSFGDSGGPLLSEQGEIVGVAHLEYTKSTPSGEKTYYSRFVNVTDPGIKCFIDALKADPSPQSGQQCVATPLEHEPSSTRDAPAP